MSYPRITVVTPSYNQAEFLRTTIVSVVSQKYPNLEYIIIDGGSTDGSVEIIREYAPQLAYWVSEKDSGQSEALEKGFACATGDLLCWLNSDDVLFPGSLLAVATAYIVANQPDVLTGNVCYIDDRDLVSCCVRIPCQNNYFGRRGVWYLQAPAIFFKRSLYKSAGGIDTSLHYSMDVDLWYRLSKLEARFSHTSEYLGGFRHQMDSKTVTFRRAEQDAFEHPETRLARNRHCPELTEGGVRWARLEYKLWRMLGLHYARGWIDSRRFGGRPWQEVLTAKKQKPEGL